MTLNEASAVVLFCLYTYGPPTPFCSYIYPVPASLFVLAFGLWEEGAGWDGRTGTATVHLEFQGCFYTRGFDDEVGEDCLLEAESMIISQPDPLFYMRWHCPDCLQHIILSVHTLTHCLSFQAVMPPSTAPVLKRGKTTKKYHDRCVMNPMLVNWT